MLKRPYPIHSHIGVFLEKVSHEYPENEALVFFPQDIRISYQDLDQLSSRFARGLIKIGIEKGDRIGIYAPNCPEWIIAQYGIAKAGAVFVPINPNYNLYELSFTLEQSEISTLILGGTDSRNRCLEVVKRLVPEINGTARFSSNRFPFLKNLILIKEEHNNIPYTFESIMNLGQALDKRVLKSRMETIDPQDIAAIHYALGTFGFPLGAMLTHFGYINNALLLGENLRLTPLDRISLSIPFFYIFGTLLGIVLPMIFASTIVALESFNPHLTLNLLEREKCTVIYGVPTMYIEELRSPELKQISLSSLRTGIMTGAPCPRDLVLKTMEEMHCPDLTIVYGLTEGGPAISQTTIDDPMEKRVSSVGMPLEGILVKVVDPVSGADRNRGEEGEICTKNSMMMKGYYRKKEESEIIIDSNGWLHTGDLGIIDEQGYCYITGRLKDMIIRGGENIYPAEIEKFISTHPKVKEVKVIGVPSLRLGEEVMAFIEPAEDGDCLSEEIREFCKNNLAKYKVPRYIRLIDGFPNGDSVNVKEFLKELVLKDNNLDV